MSFVIVPPDLLSSTATDLASIGATVNAAAAAAAAPTIEVVAAGADEVSTAIAAILGTRGESYQALNSQALAFHHDFVQAMSAGATSYATAEDAAATLLR